MLRTVSDVCSCDHSTVAILKAAVYFQEIVLSASLRIGFGFEEIFMEQPESCLGICRRIGVSQVRDGRVNLVVSTTQNGGTQSSPKTLTSRVGKSDLCFSYNRIEGNPSPTRLLCSIRSSPCTPQLHGLLGLIPLGVAIIVDYEPSLEQIAERGLQKQVESYPLFRSGKTPRNAGREVWEKDHSLHFADTQAAVLGIPAWAEKAKSKIAVKTSMRPHR